MNKTVTINLGGIVFHIDDNAYEALTKYLNAIKSRFSSEQGRDEIMQDIESRLGEMFRDRLKNMRQVIILTDVQEVTEMMGKPEEFASEETAETSGTQAEGQTYKRRVFRNPDDKVAGGVCSGIAAYFDIDPLWVRLGFVAGVFLWGATFWIYIILWIILPQAKTTAEKLMMKGEPITVSNIEKNVREEMETMKQHLKEGTKPGSAISRFFDALGQIFKYLFKAIGKIIAAFFILIGIVVAFSLFASLFGLIGLPFVHYPEIMNHIFASKAAFSWIFLGIVLLVGIPFLMLAYAGARVLFNLKKGSRTVGWSALGLWLLGILILVLNGISTISEFSDKNNFRKEIQLEQPPGKLLVLEADKKRNVEKDYDNQLYARAKWDVQYINDNIILKDIKLDIVKSPNDSFDIVEIFYSHGQSRKAALDNASKINYSMTQSDSVISFDRHFSLGKDSKWRGQKMQLLIRVPLGGKVRLDESIHGMLFDVDNVQNIHDDDMFNRSWVMTEKGLSCLDCDGTERRIGEGVVIPGNPRPVIDENGIHVTSPEGDVVSIDKNGVRIKSKDRDIIRIDEHGVVITDTLRKKKTR